MAELAKLVATVEAAPRAESAQVQQPVQKIDMVVDAVAAPVETQQTASVVQELVVYQVVNIQTAQENGAFESALSTNEVNIPSEQTVETAKNDIHMETVEDQQQEPLNREELREVQTEDGFIADKYVSHLKTSAQREAQQQVSTCTDVVLYVEPAEPKERPWFEAARRVKSTSMKELMAMKESGMAFFYIPQYLFIQCGQLVGRAEP